MADIAHKETDKILDGIEKRLRREYRKAAKDMEQKLDNYFAAFARKDEKKRELLKSGEITQQEYNNWRYGQMCVGKRWEDMRDKLATEMTRADVMARNIADGYMPEVYALNHNFATYQIETGAKVDTSYTLYDAQTVERLVRENPQILPQIGRTTQELVDKGIIKKWNMKNIQSTAIQGILQGESIIKLAKRMAADVGAANYKDCVRHARTMTTATQNAGRVDGFKRANDMGIDVVQEWVATIDGRTRHEHRLLDGQRRKVGEPFEVDGEKIMYPADPTAPYHLIMNCRCTLIGQIKGFERDTQAYRQDKDLGGMTYEEWKQGKAPKKATNKGTLKKANNITDANAQANTLLEQAYENHRVINGLSSVPLADLPQSQQVVMADYGKMSVETANAFNGALAQLMDEYDTPLTIVRSMTKDEALFNNAFASVAHDYTTDTAMLIINPLKCKNYDNMVTRIKELADDGYIIKISPDMADKYIATHEFAHTVLNIGEKLNKKTNWVNADYDKIQTARKEIEKVYDNYIAECNKLKKRADEIELKALNALGAGAADANEIADLAVKAIDDYEAVKISDYSLTNVDEFLAEAFTNEKLGIKSNPYAADVVKIIDKYFRR